MKSISKILMAIAVLLSFKISYAQIKNIKTENVKIYGNCSICKVAIEKAGNINKIAKVDWNEDSKTASISYDQRKTKRDDILKRIALSGYDNETFLAPDLAYSKLKDCCQYERITKKAVLKPEFIAQTSNLEAPKGQVMINESHIEKNQMRLVFNSYFAVKDELVKTDGNTTAAKASELVKSLTGIKMNELANDVHMIWMKVMKDLMTDAKNIAETKDIDKQRATFMRLSKNMYELIKISKMETPTYYQYCPMANDGKGANWLSKENAVKNPYYGSEMLTCGKTVETIK